MVIASEDRDEDVEVKDENLSRATAEEFATLLETLFGGDESFGIGEPIDKRSIKISEPPEKAEPSCFTQTK